MSASKLDRKMRIAFVITELEVGGAERCMVNLATRIDRDRFEPQVYSLAPRPPKNRDQLTRQLEEAGVPVHCIGATSSFQVFKAIRHLKRLLLAQSPDILQTFLYHANVVGTIAGSRAKVPAIATGIRVADPTRWRHLAERWFTRSANRIVCVSRAVAEFSRKVGRLPEQEIVTIPNGVDLSRFTAGNACDLSEFSIPKDALVAVCVGRLEYQKGIDWLVDLWPKIVARIPNGHLLLVGDGRDRAQLENRVNELKMDSAVHFAGRRQDVPELLSSCQLLILPSRWEGMPNVLLEAMASAMPVVSTNVEGVGQLLGPYGEQQTADFGDTPSFVNRICSLLADESIRQRLGQDNKSRVAGQFSLDRMVRAYQDLYESLIQQCFIG